MPLKAYIGQPRSGKSFEVVANVILAALVQGRRVVSNIAGLNYEVMTEYLTKQGHDPEKLGKLVTVDHRQVLERGFFRTDDMTALEQSFVQPGDLVALDEIWRFWEKRKAIPPDHMNFFRMHGHMVHPETNLTCEIVLLTQLMRDFHPDIKGVISETYWMVKKTELGLDKVYNVHVYERDNVPRDPARNPGIVYTKKYDPAIFPMYKSHSMAQEGQVGQEKGLDNRGSIFAGRFFKFLMPLAVLLLGFGIWKMLSFFNPEPKEPELATGEGAAQPQAGVTPAAGTQAAAAADPDWRVAGVVEIGGAVKVLLVDGEGRSRYMTPGAVQVAGTDILADVHGEKFNSWSGGRSESGIFGK